MPVAGQCSDRRLPGRPIYPYYGDYPFYGGYHGGYGGGHSSGAATGNGQ
jgi:hypothetical protein